MLIKWLVVVSVVVVVSAMIGSGGGRRWRLGELPGDLQLRLGKRRFHLPFTSTLVLSLLGWLLIRAL